MSNGKDYIFQMNELKWAKRGIEWELQGLESNDDDEDNNNNNKYNNVTKKRDLHTDKCGNTRRQKCCTKGSGKEVKIQEFVYRDTANVEPEMYGCTSNNWATGIVTRSLKENLETVPGKHSIDSLQKTAILGTAHIIRKVLQCEA